jgi:dTMP kinase
LYVSFAGIDGSGKSTQAAAVTAALRDAGLRIMPAKTKLSAMRSVFDLAAKLFGDRHGYHPGIPATLREFVVACDVVQYFTSTVQPALAAGDSVIWDRGPLCYEAYARAYGADLTWVLPMLELVRRPDVTFLLDVDPDLASQRIRARTEKAELASEQPDFLADVRKQYLALAADMPDVVTLDATQDPADLTEQVLRVLGS